MNTYIALLRGINVGGSGRLPMKELVEHLESQGCRSVRTYIQSGNAVFEHAAAAPVLTRQIRAALGAALGFEPALLLMTPKQLTRAASRNPFPEGEQDPAKLHLYFLAARPKQPDLDRLQGIAKANERFALEEDVLYLHAPDGIGRSKLAANVERVLGVSGTGRNWRTVQKLLDLTQ